MDPAFNNGHLSSEALVAHLDSELTSVSSTRVQSHLAACWHCRERLSAIERRMEDIARSAQGHRSLLEQAPARHPFLDSLATKTAPPRGNISFRLGLGMAFAGAAIALVWLVFGEPRRPQLILPPLPSRASAEQYESRPTLRVEHQVFRLELAATQGHGAQRGQGAVQHERLDVWSDPQRRHASFHFSRPNGPIALAAWAPPQHLAYLSQAQSLPEARAYAAALIQTQPNGRLRLAMGLFRELERRGFRAVGAPIWRQGRWHLTADWSSGNRKEHAWLELEAASSRPVALGLASDSPRAAWRLMLRLETEEEPAPGDIPAYAFGPSVRPVTAPVHAPGLPVPVPSAAVAPPVDLELRVLAFAGRSRAAGERVRAAQKPDGLFLEAHASSEERKAKWRGLLETWPSLNFVIETAPPPARGQWCADAILTAGEAEQAAWFLDRLEALGPPQDPEAANIRSAFNDENRDLYTRSLQTLDRLLRPVRGAPALAVLTQKQSALAAISKILGGACAGHSAATIPGFTADARSDLLGLALAARELEWNIHPK